MLILFRRRGNNEPLISTRIKRRRLFTVISLVFLLMFSSILVTSKYYNAPTKAFSADADNLVIGNGDNMYIGAGGYISQRVGSDVGSAWDSTDQLPVNAPPTGHIFTNTDVYPTYTFSMCHVISAFDPPRCHYISGDGSGMIIHFNKKIQIDGDLYIGDRVVLDAPEIVVGATGNIHANGQDGQLGIYDSCGTGGIGGISGGNNQVGAVNVNLTVDGIGMSWHPCANGAGAGLSGYSDLKRFDSGNPVATYFTSAGYPVTGGQAGASGNNLAGNPGTSIGLSADIGVGGAGPAGPAGPSGSHNTEIGSSGGAGGGFGLVFKASRSLKIWLGAKVDAGGGNTRMTWDQAKASPLYRADKNPTGGFGGPGGGGVIILDTPNIIFSLSGSTGEQADIPNYSVFDVNGGIFDILNRPAGYAAAPIYSTPGVASPGALVIKSASYSRISKQVSPLNVNPGDDVTVTLTIPVALGAYDVTDEVLNDGQEHYFSIVSLQPGCTAATDGKSVSCPGTTTTPIIYHLKAPVY